jgi:hypothetical protein
MLSLFVHFSKSVMDMKQTQKGNAYLSNSEKMAAPNRKCTSQMEKNLLMVSTNFVGSTGFSR